MFRPGGVSRATCICVALERAKLRLATPQQKHPSSTSRRRMRESPTRPRLAHHIPTRRRPGRRATGERAIVIFLSNFPQIVDLVSYERPLDHLFIELIQRGKNLYGSEF